MFWEDCQNVTIMKLPGNNFLFGTTYEELLSELFIKYQAKVAICGTLDFTVMHDVNAMIKKNMNSTVCIKINFRLV